MPEWILLLPLIFPPIAALAFALAAPRVSESARARLPIALTLVEIILILINGAPGLHRLALSEWEVASFTFALEIDGITFVLWLAIFSPLLLLSSTSFDPFAYIVLSAAAFLLTAASPIAICAALVALDATLFLWRLARGIERETALRALAAGQLTTLILFAGALLAGTRAQNESAWLIALALWGRLGLFPFHWLPLARGASTRDLWIARGAPLIAAQSLWLHWEMDQVPVPAETIAALSALALIAIYLWSRQEEEPSRAASAMFSFGIAAVPLAIAFGGNAARALAFWLTLGNACALILFEMALKWRAEGRIRWTRWLWLAGLLSLAGFPLTPAFLGRAGVYASLWQANQFALLIVNGLISLAVLFSLWRFAFGIQAAQHRAPVRAEYVPLVLIAVTLVGLTLSSLALAPALSETMGASAESALDRVIRTSDAAAVFAGFVFLLAPLIAAFPLARLNLSLPPRADAILRAAARVGDLTWLITPLMRAVYRVGAFARDAGALVESNPTIWVLLAALWIAILVLFPR